MQHDKIPEELTKSMWGDVVRQCDGDKDKAHDLVRNMTHDVAEQEKQEMQERVVHELEHTFKDLGRGVIVRLLTENNWDADKAILPLFELLEKQKEQERQHQREVSIKKREQERLSMKKNAAKRAKQFFQQLFSDLPDEEIQRHLDANEGDVDATVDQLLAIVSEKESKEKKQRQEQEEQELVKKQLALEKQFKTDTLYDRFGEYVSKSQVIEALNNSNLDVVIASKQLLEITETRKIEQLQRLFNKISYKEIRQALNINNWEMKATTEALTASSSSSTSSTSTIKIKNNSTSEKIKSLNGKEKIDDDNDNDNDKDKDDDFLLRSAILGKELNELIMVQRAEVEREADAGLLFRKELEQKLRFGPEDVPGLPGMIPVTRKMIDRLKSPVIAQDEEDESVGPSQPSSSSSSSKTKISPFPLLDNNKSMLPPTSTSASRLRLQVTPDRLDKGAKFTVSWETEEEVTTSDWIGMYPVTADGVAPVKSYYTWNWIGKAERRGSLQFQADKFGDYVFRYCSNRGYQVMAISAPIRVGPEYIVNARQREANARTVDVEIRQVSGNMYTKAWLAMYEGREASNSAYKTYQWLSSAVDHTLTFEVPKAGEWEFRLFPEARYVDMARATLTVRGQDRLDLVLEDKGAVMRIKPHIATVDPTAENVWIGIYKTEETDNKLYRKYKYVSSSSDEVTFRACTTPATYEARLFANRYYDGCLCKSNSVQIV